jgi:hypothetical protein
MTACEHNWEPRELHASLPRTTKVRGHRKIKIVARRKNIHDLGPLVSDSDFPVED